MFLSGKGMHLGGPDQVFFFCDKRTRPDGKDRNNRRHLVRYQVNAMIFFAWLWGFSGFSFPWEAGAGVPDLFAGPFSGVFVGKGRTILVARRTNERC